MPRPSPHDLDQEQAFLRGLAVVAAGYLEALESQGVPPVQALTLARDWHAHFLQVTHDPDRDRSEGETGADTA